MRSVGIIFDEYECVYCSSAGQKRRLVSRLGAHGIDNGLQLGATSGLELRKMLERLPVEDIQFTCTMAEACTCSLSNACRRSVVFVPIAGSGELDGTSGKASS